MLCRTKNTQKTDFVFFCNFAIFQNLFSWFLSVYSIDKRKRKQLMDFPSDALEGNGHDNLGGIALMAPKVFPLTVWSMSLANPAVPICQPSQPNRQGSQAKPPKQPNQAAKLSSTVSRATSPTKTRRQLNQLHSRPASQPSQPPAAMPSRQPRRQTNPQTALDDRPKKHPKKHPKKRPRKLYKGFSIENWSM